MTAREEDELVEKLCAARLDKYWELRGFRSRREQRREFQVRGVDVWLSRGGKPVPVDEKAKWRCLEKANAFGQELANMSFEVSRVCADGERRVGWFSDPESLTQAYIFCFPAFNCNDFLYGISPMMKCWYVAKKQVEGLAEKAGFAPEKLFQMSLEAAEGRVFELGGLSLRASDGKNGTAETLPVNLLIPSSRLRALSSFKVILA